MGKHRSRRKKYIFKKTLVLIICFLVVFFCYKSYDYIKNDEDNNIKIEDISGEVMKSFLKFEITSKSESDIESIDNTFQEGMSLKDFNSVLENQPSIIKEKGSYQQINYNFEKKLHYSEIENYLKEMSKSDIVHLEVIGKSVDNRNIYGIEIGKGDRVLYMDANIHAAEVASTLFLTRFLSDLVNKYELNDEDTIETLNNVKIAVLPCINPDGYEVYNFGVESLRNKDLWWYQNKDKISFSNIKSNANGVDINRNFPTQNAGIVLSGKKLIKNVSLEKTFSSNKYFNGDVVGSEPETRASMYFMLKHYKNMYAYINLHSQGRVIYAGKPNLSNEFNKLTQNFAKKTSKINNYVVHGLSSEEVGEGNDGTATDFMAELANGFIFSSQTGRLYTDKHVNNSCYLEYKFPVITMETLKVWTSDPSVFKDEYYNYGIEKVFYSIISNEF